MSTNAESPARLTTDRPEPTEVPVGRRSSVRWVLAALAAALCLVAIPQPLWKATLEAPQYHGDGALRITAYGDKLVGDICEINDLNHYIGMQRLGEPSIPCGSAALGRGENTVGRIAPEMVLWLPSAIIAAIACVVAMRVGNRWLRWLSLVFLWGLPAGVLVMTQYHLYVYGHDLDPEAAFHPKPFTPHVLFHSRIYQFDVDASLGLGLQMVIAAAVLVTFGPWLVTKSVNWLLPKLAPELSKKLNRRLARHALVAMLLAGSGWLLTGAARPDDSLAAGTTVADVMGAELAARLAAAQPGDVLRIEAGIYRGNFVIDAGVELIGVDAPVLDGGGTGTVLTITESARGARLSGLHLIGSGPGPSDTPAALRILADDVVVEGIVVADSYTGIQVGGADSVRVTGCYIEGAPGGVLGGELHATGGLPDATGMDHMHHPDGSTRMLGDAISLLSTSNAVIEGNTIVRARDGVYMSFATDATVRGNSVSDSRYAIHGMYAERLLAEGNYFEGNLAGAILMYGGPFDVRNNTILHSKSPSTGFGVVVKDGLRATIEGNVIVANRVGLKIDNGGADSAEGAAAILTNNTIAMNQIGVELMTATTATFTLNGFVENTVQVVTDGKVHQIDWSADGVGNFWSNYKGYDSDGDGIGDIGFVQGGTIARTLTRSPVILALASGPGFRLLQAVEDRWAPENPVALDEYPLMDRRSPAVTGELRPPPAPTWFGVGGGVVAVASCWVLFRSRRPRRIEDA